jgi:hypothetical protein
MQVARHDFVVHFHGNAAGRHLQRREELRYGERSWEFARLAIQDNLQGHFPAYS